MGLLPYAIPGVTGLCIGLTYWLFRLYNNQYVIRSIELVALRKAACCATTFHQKYKALLHLADNLQYMALCLRPVPVCWLVCVSLVQVGL